MSKFKSLALQLDKASRKKVLSNKALTSRVRGLTGQEGRRKYKEQKLYDGVSLVANTADINYLTELNGLSNHVIHNLRFSLIIMLLQMALQESSCLKIQTKEILIS